MQSCPKCHKKFSKRYFLCSKCNIELTSSKVETPDLVVLCSVLNEAKAYIMRGFLENEGIPCQLENISFHAEPAPVADLMKVRLWTLREDGEQALRLLAEVENIRVCSACVTQVDENVEVCPYCGERMEEY